MDMDNTTETQASRMVRIQETITGIENSIAEDCDARSQARNNNTLSNRELSILLCGFDLCIAKQEREILKLKSQLATLRLNFQKETFWRNL
jgi:hypothetical protein